MVALRRKMADEAGLEAEKKRKEWLERARDAAAGIAEHLRQAAGIVLGKGADAWKAVQDASRSNRAAEAERTMLQRSGASALDEESKRNLREMRDYLFELVNAETVPL
jgi:cell division septum initiation protein DivIVA